MNKRLYLDGCSFTYGEGLSRSDTLAHLFETNGDYIVTDNSRPGKSNLAIALDTYQNLNNHDVFVIGFTFSTRFYLNVQGTDIDLLESRRAIQINDSLNGDQLEEAYRIFHKYFFLMYDTPFAETLSDFLVDSVIAQIENNKKKYCCFSWEKRKSNNKVWMPFFSANYRLEDGHLNKQGTGVLYNQIQEKLRNE